MLSPYSYPYFIDLMQGKNLKQFQNGFFRSKISLDKNFIEILSSDINELKTQLMKDKPSTKWKTLNYANSFIKDAIYELDAKNEFILRNYLGNYSIDICYLFGTKYGSEHRNSQNWHHDSVGKRLKMFYVIEPDTQPTLLIEKRSGANRILNPILSDIERKTYKPKNDISNIQFMPGYCYFIDTNFMHSGIKGVQNTIRVAFVCEISNKYKKYARGRVGPRSEP